jgi:hypothetical protein
MNRSEHAGPEIGNPFLHQQSDSLITGLCREMEGLRSRCDQLIEELARSREESLADRLRRELKALHLRQQDLQRSVHEMRRGRLRRFPLAGIPGGTDPTTADHLNQQPLRLRPPIRLEPALSSRR